MTAIDIPKTPPPSTPYERWYFQQMILRVEVGSTAHGTGLPGAEDHDEMAIVLEPPRYRLGLGHFETYVYRPGRAPTEKSQAGDLDLVIHSLHKFIRLALKGNPSILAAFWSPVIQASYIGRELRTMGPSFISQHAVNAYLGYAKAQRERLQRSVKGESPGHMPDRPELVEQFGFDTKYAMHMVRLGLQGIELLTTGGISFPTVDRELLFDIRCGRVPLKEILRLAEINEQILNDLRQEGVPESPDHGAIGGWLANTYMSAYRDPEWLLNSSFEYDIDITWEGKA